MQDPTEEDVAAAIAAATALSVVVLLIAQVVLTESHFILFDRRAFVVAQARGAELQLLCSRRQAAKTPTPEKLAGESAKTKQLAQILPFVYERDYLLFCKQPNDLKRKLTLVPAEIVKAIIRYFHEGPGVANQAAKATAAKTYRTFYWPDYKNIVRFYIASCLGVKKFLRLCRTPIAGLWPMEVGSRGDCLAMDIVGGKDSLPTTFRGNCYILTMIDCFLRYAVAVTLFD